MPDLQRELAMTRVAFLEIKDEQRLVQEGFELLDEKRILLATEIQRQLVRLRALRRQTNAAQDVARAALLAALSCHGLDELSLYPPLPVGGRVAVIPSRLLGLELIDARLTPADAETDAPGTMPARPGESETQPSERPVNPTQEARECARAHRRWLEFLVELAACCVNLRRLTREYVRTERRARAIENILLPEIDSSLKRIDEQLESIDQEEIARLRHRRAGGRE